jgi:hypothetical protein
LIFSSKNAILQGRFKLIIGDPKVRYAGWDGPIYPNSSSAISRPDFNTPLYCEQGCLFDVVSDPGEHNDLAAHSPEIVLKLKNRLEELKNDFYENDDLNVDSCPKGIDIPCACWMAINYYGGYFGPYQEIGSTIQ